MLSPTRPNPKQINGMSHIVTAVSIIGNGAKAENSFQSVLTEFANLRKWKMIPMTTDEYLTIMIFNAILFIIFVWLGVKYWKESEGGENDDM